MFFDQEYVKKCYAFFHIKSMAGVEGLLQIDP